MSTPDLSQPKVAPPPDAAVAAAILVRDGSRLAESLDAVVLQSYETVYTAVVGGGEEARNLARGKGVDWVPDMRALVGALPDVASHVWLVHDDAFPRRDSLETLVKEADRVDASVAGSKLLRADRSHILESVGAATDVFLEPYSGLESEEMDQAQYDVVRDVAFVYGASTLVRKDLFKGLGGTDPLLAPQAAGIDLSHRARVAGGRVVVVPSSEVLHAGRCAATVAQWREEAGRLRTQLKLYRPVTLAWTVPITLLLGILHAAAMTFLGRRWALLDLVRVWGWNLFRLPSTVAARRKLNRSRLARDEEIFRYQVRGSVLVRALGDRLSSQVGPRLGETGRVLEIVERGRGFWQRPGFYAAVGAILILVLAGRSILANGLPASGLALPLPESAWATLRSYAGGWNTSGLGSPEPLRPVIGATALVHLLSFSNARLAEILLTVGLTGAGWAGTVRLLRRLEFGLGARYAAALALTGGPATRALLASGDWPGLMAIALIPWAVESVVAPWPFGVRARLGYVARSALVTGLLAASAPVAVLLPVTAVTVRAIVAEDARWSVAARAVPATILAVPFLFPWLHWISVDELLTGGTGVFLAPSLWPVAALLAALALGLLFGDRRAVGTLGWGGVLAVGGGLLARTTELGVGREPVVAGYAAAAFGTALVVGAVLDLPGRLQEAGLWRILGGRGAALAGLVVAAGMVLLVPAGRMGLPEDRFGDGLAFAAARAQDHGSDRILITGPAETLPGTTRSADGLAYRVVPGSGPIFPEAWLADPRVGDTELAGALDRVAAGGELRPGQLLAPFGIRWIVFTESNSLLAALESQLDLRQLPGLEYPTFESEVFSPRAVAENGVAWSWDRPDYVAAGSTSGSVYVAENRDDRWGAGWTVEGWANRVIPSDGRVSFSGDRTLRAWAVAAGAWLMILVVMGAYGRRSTRR